jgi:hypothetical protein
MKTLTKIGIAGLGSIAATLMTPAISMAETGQATAEKSTNGHSLVHRVSHSLASAESYSKSGTSGYKWGKKTEQAETSQKWADNTTTRGGYKWGTSAAQDSSQSLAESSYEWGTMSFSEQSGYRWGMKNFSDQSGYRWGMKTFADQSGYRWGMKTFADQSGYRWGMKTFADQSGYRWGMKTFADQSGYRWGMKAIAETVE